MQEIARKSTPYTYTASNSFKDGIVDPHVIFRIFILKFDHVSGFSSNRTNIFLEKNFIFIFQIFFSENVSPKKFF